MMDVRKICNCGKPSRYIHMNNDTVASSCNKHFVCPTYDELVKKNQELTRELHKKSALLDKIKSVFVDLGVQNVTITD